MGKQRTAQAAMLTGRAPDAAAAAAVVPLLSAATAAPPSLLLPTPLHQAAAASSLKRSRSAAFLPFAAPATCQQGRHPASVGGPASRRQRTRRASPSPSLPLSPTGSERSAVTSAAQHTRGGLRGASAAVSAAGVAAASSTLAALATAVQCPEVLHTASALATALLTLPPQQAAQRLVPLLLQLLHSVTPTSGQLCSAQPPGRGATQHARCAGHAAALPHADSSGVAATVRLNAACLPQDGRPSHL